jgi:hypothetical protein
VIVRSDVGYRYMRVRVGVIISSMQSGFETLPSTPCNNNAPHGGELSVKT